MWHHFVSLLSHSWVSFLRSMGTTGLGFFTPLVVFAATSIVTLVVLFVQQGKNAVKEHLRRTVTLAALVPLAVMVIVYGVIFCWNIVTTVYEDHTSLIFANAKLIADVREAKNNNAQLEADNKRTLDENERLKARCAGCGKSLGQASSGAGGQLPPPVQDMRVVSQDWVPSTNPKFRVELRVIVQTNVVIQPVSLVFVCDHNVEDGNVQFAGDQGVFFIKVRNGVLIANHKAYLASFEQPPFTPEKNMIVTLFSNEPIRVLSFGRVPFIF